jgi:hypothetical protein
MPPTTSGIVYGIPSGGCRRLPECHKIGASIHGRVSRENNLPEQEPHGGAHAESARLKRRVECGGLSFLPTRDLPASFRPHQREHLSVIEKSALRRPRPMRADDDLFAESNNRPDGELVYVEAPTCFGEGLGHEFLVKRPHARDDRQLSTPVPLRAPHPVS